MGAKISYADTKGYITFSLAEDVFTMIGQLKSALHAIAYPRRHSLPVCTLYACMR